MTAEWNPFDEPTFPWGELVAAIPEDLKAYIRRVYGEPLHHGYDEGGLIEPMEPNGRSGTVDDV